MLSQLQSYSEDGRRLALWEELGTGTPTLMAFARLCGHALASNQCEPVEPLTEEACSILYTARNRGAMEIKGVDSAFDSSERFLAICVELDAERQIVFRRREEPELTIRFLDGFRQLCASGLVMHHIFRDFSLTRAGFDLARSLARDDLPTLAALAEEQVIDDY
jgi:hypothetical protein